jgi:4-alpha-glucanotransferase
MKEGSPYNCYSAFAGDTRYIGKVQSNIKYNDFAEENSYWLNDYALFNVLKSILMVCHGINGIRI